MLVERVGHTHYFDEEPYLLVLRAQNYDFLENLKLFYDEMMVLV